MSKSSKARRKNFRTAEKRKRKAANKAKYEGWRDAGTNQKSKRFLKSASQVRLVRMVRHRFGPCGNAGCKQCAPINLAQWRAKLQKREQEQRLEQRVAA